MSSFSHSSGRKPSKRSSGRRRGRLFWFALLVLLPLAWVLVPAVAYIWLPVPATPLMLWRTLAEGEGWQRTWVPLKSLPNLIPRAVIASEDNRFCTHKGVDWVAVQQVYDDWQDGKRLRGASTVSMQVARNVFLWPNQDPVRKALEVPITYLIEKLWGKRRIMEVYLNIAEWGPGVYGIEAAARHHYGKKARQLTRDEVFRLVSILPSPRKWKPQRLPARVRARAATFGTRLAQLGPLVGCVSK